MDQIIGPNSINYYSELIAQQQVVIFDDFPRQHISGEHYITNVSIALCERGYAKFEYDGRFYEIQPHDFCIVLPGHIARINELSEDLKIRVISISEEFHNKFKHLNFTRYNAHYSYNVENPVCHFTDEQFRQMNEAFNLLQTVCTIGKLRRERMLLNVFHTIVMMRYEYYPIDVNAANGADANISIRFQELVINNYSESHKVEFYAEKLKLSAKYLSAVIKKELNVTPHQWITRYVILQAKTMLNRRSDLNIKQISKRMGFNEQAEFCRFFRKYAGVSPTKYRTESGTL